MAPSHPQASNYVQDLSTRQGSPQLIPTSLAVPPAPTDPLVCSNFFLSIFPLLKAVADAAGSQRQIPGPLQISAPTTASILPGPSPELCCHSPPHLTQPHAAFEVLPWGGGRG